MHAFAFVRLRAFGATSHRDLALRASEDSTLRASDSINNSFRSALRENKNPDRDSHPSARSFALSVRRWIEIQRFAPLTRSVTRYARRFARMKVCKVNMALLDAPKYPSPSEHGPALLKRRLYHDEHIFFGNFSSGKCYNCSDLLQTKLQIKAQQSR